ncbi:uncharacterized protein LOC114292024 [Camellia sinensis]|uniref:uncharacterized protein LOC114292024 n=1 Tax=Camellia sinensis TaxID=4442 RepID=UPI001035D0B5|nr:uncharacterized protein LOC114292024 [Camellia sinensis]
MENTNARNVDESESSSARIDRLERMVEALTGLKYKKLKPPEFAGGIEPLKAEAWVLETEKIFEVFPCTNVYKVLLATFTLTEEARRWWMLVRDYKKARKFEGGLHVEVLDRVNVLKLEKYVDVLDRALMAETNIANLKMCKPTAMTEAESKKFKKQKVETVSESMGSVNENLTSKFSDNTKRENGGSVGVPTCRECGKQHWGICRRGTGVCFKCGQPGHIAKACPQVYSRNERPIASGVNSIMTPKTTVTSAPEGNTLRQ